MPKYYAPISGFSDKNVCAIKIDNVDDYLSSSEIHVDGTERVLGSKNHFAQIVPTWTQSELDKMVKSGKWKEVAPPDRSTPPTPIHADLSEEKPDDAIDIQH